VPVGQDAGLAVLLDPTELQTNTLPDRELVEVAVGDLGRDPDAAVIV
jgi:hypothetical protein